MSTIQEKIGMPLKAFLEAYHQQPFELINGERRLLMSPVAGHSDLTRTLFLALYSVCQINKTGEPYSETSFILPDTYDADWVTGSRIPDVMFYEGKRIPDYRERTPNWRQRPFALVPDFVIEIVSPDDKVSELDEKIDAYLADGVRLIWVIDPQRRKAIVYGPDFEQPRHYAGNDMLDADDIVPGFKVKLSDLFA